MPNWDFSASNTTDEVVWVGNSSSTGLALKVQGYYGANITGWFIGLAAYGPTSGGYGIAAYGGRPILASCVYSGGVAITGNATGTSGTGGDFEVTGSGATGVYCASLYGYSLYANGTGHFGGYLEKPGGGFVTDHPVTPDTHILNHEFCESPKAQNLYRGSTVLGTDGKGVGQLPDYYSAANANGEAFLTTKTAESGPIIGNEFSIVGVPGSRVGWLVVADRDDLWQRTHGRPDVTAKEASKIGTFLNPELRGFGVDRHYHDAPKQAAARRAQEQELEDQRALIEAADKTSKKAE